MLMPVFLPWRASGAYMIDMEPSGAHRLLILFFLAVLCVGLACREDKPTSRATALDVAPEAGPPLPPLVAWRADASDRLADPVIIDELGLRFRPPAGWARSEGKVEWLGADGDSTGSVGIRVLSGPGLGPPFTDDPERFLEKLAVWYRTLEGGGFEIDRVERVRIGAQTHLAVTSHVRMGEFTFVNLQLLIERQGRVVITTYSAVDDAFTRLIGVFRASAASLELLQR
jgi:hypothetical protein